jgi:hypothetical protein
MLKEYEVVRLRQTLPSVPLPQATEGVVVFVHAADPPAYEVEFVDVNGETIGVYTVEEKNLEIVG